MDVIVGIDGSEQQPDALALGAQLARIDGGHLTLAHVYPWSRWSVRLGVPYEVKIREDTESLLHGAQAAVGDDVPSTIRAVADLSPPRGLHRMADEQGADVVVVGSSHRGPVGRAMLGSVGDRVVHAAPCAVAVAPRSYEAPAEGLRRIALAYDGSDEARVALDWAARLAAGSGATVEVLSVLEPALPALGYPGGMAYDFEALEAAQREECRRHLDEAVAMLPASVEPTGEILTGGVGLALATAAADMDLVVVGSRGYGPVRTTILGSVSRSLVHHSPRPVVVVPRGVEAPSGPAAAAAAVEAER